MSINAKITPMTEGKFIPTQEQWWEYYGKWPQEIANSRCKDPNDHEHDLWLMAAMDAILKVMGKHERYHLQDPLIPRTEAQWFRFCRIHTYGIVSNLRRHDMRSVSRSVTEESESADFGTVNFNHSLVEGVVDRDELRRIIRRLCKAKGFSDEKITAFLISAGVEKGRITGFGCVRSLQRSNKKILECLQREARNPHSELAVIWDSMKSFAA